MRLAEFELEFEGEPGTLEIFGLFAPLPEQPATSEAAETNAKTPSKGDRLASML
jgi:hypothetical protein